jgi:hypothetical protein
VAFGVEPASSTGPDGRSNFSLSATPGAILFDDVSALNFSTKPLSLQLYATDAIETAGGGFGLLPESTKPVGAGSWITIPPDDATVQVPAASATGPGQIVVPITVHVPDKASPGDHAGGVVVSLRTVGTNASGQNVVLEQRVGTRVYIRVSGTIAPRLVVSDVHGAYQGTLNPIGQGRARISYRVTNAGNVSLSVSQSIAVSGLLGSQSHVDMARVPLLLPGASLAESASVAHVWPQFLEHATVTARSHVIVDSSNVVSVAAASSSTRLWAVPWTLLIIIAAIVIAIVVLLRRRSRPQGRHARGAGS